MCWAIGHFFGGLNQLEQFLAFIARKKGRVNSCKFRLTVVLMINVCRTLNHFDFSDSIAWNPRRGKWAHDCDLVGANYYCQTPANNQKWHSND